jgi:hypothetical protein
MSEISIYRALFPRQNAVTHHHSLLQSTNYAYIQYSTASACSLPVYCVVFTIIKTLFWCSALVQKLFDLCPTAVQHPPYVAF